MANNKLRAHLGLSDLVQAGKDRSLDGDLIHKIIEGAISEALFAWASVKLPGHFETSAPRKYSEDYVARKKRYMKTKAKQKGHQRPMEWTGTMRNQLLSGRPSTAGKKAKERVQTEMRLPYARAANFWTGKKVRSPIDFHRELTAFNEEDLKWFVAYVELVALKKFGEEANKASDGITAQAV